MMVLMERDTSVPAPPSDYRVIAMRLVATGERELREAGAEGFRISVVPNHEQEGVFVLHRTPGTGERFDYQIGLHQRPGRARAPACAMIAAELRSTGPVEAGTS